MSGHYEYLGMPYGLSNAPFVFQAFEKQSVSENAWASGGCVYQRHPDLLGHLDGARCPRPGNSVAPPGEPSVRQSGEVLVPSGRCLLLVISGQHAGSGYGGEEGRCSQVMASPNHRCVGLDNFYRRLGTSAPSPLLSPQR